MDDAVHANVEAIQNMEAACGRWSTAVNERLEIVEIEILCVTERLEDRKSELRNEISDLRDQIDSAGEEEDTGSLESQLEEAEDALAAVRRQLRDLSEAVTAYRPAARKITALADGHAVSARHFLRGVVDDLKAYLALSMEENTRSVSGAPHSFVDQVGRQDIANSNSNVSQRFGLVDGDHPLSIANSIPPVDQPSKPAKDRAFRLEANKAAGKAWETELLQAQLPKTQSNIRPQITIKSRGASQQRVRLDAVGIDQSGKIRLSDGKASHSAPLTPNQKAVYPELETDGGTVAGEGKPPYTGGTEIPPTKVDIIRKP